MGFLTTYDGTERVELDGGYWVDLRKHLSTGAKETADRHLQTMTVVDGKPCPAPDVVRARQQLVLASIDGWNLDDDNGHIWPINIQSVKRLPETVFDRLREKIEDLAAPLPAEERAQFPDESPDSDPHGHPRPAVATDVPDGTGTVQTPRGDQGDVPEPSGA